MTKKVKITDSDIEANTAEGRRVIESLNPVIDQLSILGHDEWVEDLTNIQKLIDLRIQAIESLQVIVKAAQRRFMIRVGIFIVLNVTLGSIWYIWH